jgi:hypothetical protein
VWSLFASETDFNAYTLHDTRAVTKSVVSLFFGIAREQGKIGNPSTPIVDFYPQYPELRTPCAVTDPLRGCAEVARRA